MQGIYLSPLCRKIAWHSGPLLPATQISWTEDVVREVVHQRGNFRLEVLPSNLQQAFVEQEASAAEMIKAVSRRMVPL